MTYTSSSLSRRVLSLGSIVLLCSTFGLTACDQGFTVHVAQAELSEAARAQFPKTLSLPKGFTLDLRSPVLTLNATPDKRGKIVLDVDLLAQRPMIPIGIKGKARIEGRLRYDKKGQTIFMDELKVMKVDVDIPGGLSGAMGQQVITTAINKSLDKEFASVPLYTLDPKEHNVVARKMLKNVSISQGKLALHFGL